MTVARKQLKRTLLAAAAPKEPLGIVTGIVAVTNHEDSVQDVVVPGAFADTLSRLRPKLCWMHDWKAPLGRVLWIIELKPGDKRLPKTLPDGRAWPQEAGAVVAQMQFNLRTEAGREMFEHAREWAKNGEAAFSIGYKVRPGMASKRADGVRLIYGLDLYEVSLVLHGAHNMALALEVKDAAGAALAGLEFMDSPTGLLEVKAAEPMIGDGAMVALYLDPQVAGDLAVPDGNPPGELHVTLAFLGGDGAVPDPQPILDALRPVAAGHQPLAGQVGGIGVFPDGENGTPVWVPVDVPGLTELRQAVVAALEAAGHQQQSEHGYTPHVTLGYDLPSLDPVPPTPVEFGQVVLTVGEQRYPLTLGEAPMEGKAHEAVAVALGLRAGLEGKGGVPGVADTPSDHAAVERLRRSWSHGSMAAEIGWGTGGDFDRCVALATEHMGPEEAKGWCNLRHHDALGIYPATHAKLEGKALPKSQKCKYGDEPATKRIIHAEGRAYIPVCDKHLAKGKAAAAKATPSGESDPSNIDAIRPIEGKSAAHAVLEAKDLSGGSAGTVTVQSLGAPTRVASTKKRAKRTPLEGQETKMMPQMRGSLEERRDGLQRALDALYRKTEKDEHVDSGEVGDSPCHVWVCIDATFEDNVVFTVEDDGERQSYRVTYEVQDGEVALGQPVKVDLDVVAVPDSDDEAAEPEKVEEGEAVVMRFIDPATLSLADAARRINAMPEGKAAFGAEFESGLLALMDALAVKGYDVAGAVMGDEPDPEEVDEDPADEGDSLTDVPVDEAPDAPEEGDEEDPDAPAADAGKDTITLDPETVRAQMEELNT